MSWHRWGIALALMTMAVLARATAQTSQIDDVTLRLIVVASADEARRVVEKLRQGESFVTLARSVSIDPTADSGGLLGKVSLATLRPELRNALQGVAAEQITGVIQVPTGFAVLKVVANTEAAASAGPVKNPAVAATGSVKYVFGVSGLGVISNTSRTSWK